MLKILFPTLFACLYDRCFNIGRNRNTPLIKRKNKYKTWYSAISNRFQQVPTFNWNGPFDSDCVWWAVRGHGIFDLLSASAACKRKWESSCRLESLSTFRQSIDKFYRNICFSVLHIHASLLMWRQCGVQTMVVQWNPLQHTCILHKIQRHLFNNLEYFLR